MTGEEAAAAAAATRGVAVEKLDIVKKWGINTYKVSQEGRKEWGLPSQSRRGARKTAFGAGDGSEWPSHLGVCMCVFLQRC